MVCREVLCRWPYVHHICIDHHWDCFEDPVWPFLAIGDRVLKKEEGSSSETVSDEDEEARSVQLVDDDFRFVIHEFVFAGALVEDDYQAEEAKEHS